jgi:hypothetical protein
MTDPGRIAEVSNSAAVTRIFAITLFLSAFLVFLCQPMVGKMLLPYLGGSAGVWTTCVLFFQAMLLAGYVYAHFLGKIADTRRQILIHGIILLLPLAFLPIQFDQASSQATMLLQLLISAGVPFFVVSTTAPLLQTWFSKSKDSSANDPYFLYSASNAGSLLALMAYPFFIEPVLGVALQSHMWLALYVLLIPLIVLSASRVWRKGSTVVDDHHQDGTASPDVRSRLYWTVAAFVPSALMLAVTNHIAADLASMPFLWTMPLAIYLLTFILAFARRWRVSSSRVSRIIPAFLLLAFPFVATGIAAPVGLNWVLIAIHLLVLYFGALLCHTALAERRPDSRHLTEYYFWIALGGVLGGVFTALVAPVVFNTVFEYPLLVASLPLFRSTKSLPESLRVPVLLGLTAFGSWFVLYLFGRFTGPEVWAFVHTAVLFISFRLKDHFRRFAMTFAVMVLVYAWVIPPYIEGATRIHTTRNFFGMKKILEDQPARLRKLLHGSTIHGVESLDPARVGQPLSYYHTEGTVGNVMDILRAREKPQRIGVIGLGAGSMAAYASSDLHISFFEIDKSVETIAHNYFTFLQRCGTNCDVVIEDGRLAVAQAPDGAFDLLMLDAFSSDSIPAHLVSTEAMTLYLSKLAPDGILLFHVSNRYLDVERLVSALVVDAGLVGLSRYDAAGDLSKEGKTNTSHIVAARRAENLGPLVGKPGWNEVVRPPDFRPWTDDYSNLLGLVRWR